MLKRQAILLVGLVLSAGPALADPTHTQERRPGVMHGGRFYGFVPAHEKNQKKKSPHSETDPSTPSPADSDAAIVPVALEEELTPTELEVGDFQDAEAESEAITESDADVVATPLPTDEMVIDGSADGFHEWIQGPPACGPDPGCCPMLDLWGHSEVMLWWTQGMDAPALATTSPAGTAQNEAGILGLPGTSVLFGNGGLTSDSRLGGRFTIGNWFDPCRCHGVQVSYLRLEDETESARGSSNEFSILARPFLNTVTSGQDARLISFPGLVSGTLNVEATTDFQAVEVLYRRQAMWWCCFRVDYLLGYRMFELEDRLRVDESTLSLSGATAGTSFDLFDQFETRNRFHGAEVGVLIQWESNRCWSWEATAKLALGGMDSRGVVTGQTVTTSPAGAATTTPGGLLTQQTNLGRFTQEDFEAISEFGITLRRQLQCGVTATLGYSFIYWSNVMRAGDQVDTTINTTQIPPGTLNGTARPAFPLATTDFWAQGLRAGFEYRY